MSCPAQRNHPRLGKQLLPLQSILIQSAVTVFFTEMNIILCMFAPDSEQCLNHDNRISTVRRLNLCMNCLNNSHFIKNCNSSHKCKKCQQSHHTMIHNETHNDAAPRFSDPFFQPLSQVASNAAVKLKSSALLRTLSEDHRSPRTSCPPGHLVLGSHDLPRTTCPPLLLVI